MSPPQVDLDFVGEVVARRGRHAGELIAALQEIQAHYRYLPTEAMQRLADLAGWPLAEIVGVASFYSQFRFRPLGRHLVRVCHGTACHVKGAPRVTAAIMSHLGIDASGGADTDADGLFTVEQVACLGCCTLAPAVQIDDVTYGHVSPQRVGAMLKDFLSLPRGQEVRQFDEVGAVSAAAGEVRVGLGSCCVARSSRGVYEAAAVALRRLGSPARLKSVGCVGMCHQTPLLEVVDPGGESFLYGLVRPQDVEGILSRHMGPRRLMGRLALSARRAVDWLTSDDRIAVDASRLDPSAGVVQAFMGPQRHVATAGCGHLTPTDMDEYRSAGGFEALRRCVEELSGEQVIDIISESGLRGRGGAGFPTGRKWRLVAGAEGQKVVVCNGDEGDPGAFMDRMLMESYPYRVLEGMAIAACAVGAAEGILYIRAEYPLAVQRVQQALDEMTRRGMLGGDALGQGRGLTLRIMQGAGAFVCGEETALLASIEGRRGMPRFRPPYPAQQGLWGRPTLVNNVETFAMVPWIIRRGGLAFAAMGTASSAGTKVFALAGKVRRGGLIEVPMGATVRQIVEEIGGGVVEGRTLKAVQIGGPSGGCIPASRADTPIDYEALAAAGAIMGSGGLVVLDDSDCMVEIARYFLEFTQGQSCGKCTFCRVGTRRMLDILNALCEGKGRAGDLDRLETLARQVQAASLCGLGRTAPNPVLSTLEHFRSEYQAHVEGACPAGVCRELIDYSVGDSCIGCTLCAQNCPVDAIAMIPHQQHRIEPAVCVRCGVCMSTCPQGAISFAPRRQAQPHMLAAEGS